MNRAFVVTLVAGASMLFSAGCATKNYARQQMSPVVSKVNDLDAMTAKNSHDIRDTDTRAQAGIQDANTKAAAADQKAQVASQQADQAQTLASNAANRVNSLADQVSNLDNYKTVAEANIHFAFGKADLSRRSKEALDELAQNVPNTKGFIISLEGGTDSVGSPEYNYELSNRRAEAVVQYLAQKHDVPAHKIYVIGLGKDKMVASNASARGRAQNRRVEVRLMTNVVGTPDSNTTAQAQPISR